MLWIAPGVFGPAQASEAEALLRRLILHPWAAVFVDVVGLALEELRDEHVRVGDLPLRMYTADPPTAPPPNRVPVFFLPGAPARDGDRPAATPIDTLNRLQMLRRGAQDAELFVVGVRGGGDVASLREALGISDAFRRLVFVTPEPRGPVQLEGAERVSHWTASLDAFLAFLDHADELEGETERLLVRVEGADGPKAVNLYRCVDQSNPITDAFAVIPLANVLDERPATLEDVQSFLADPTSSWRPYAAGVPHVRHEPHRRDVFELLKRFRRDGAAATLTAWMPADDGSGATTSLRHLAFDLARAGYPVLVARPEVERFDFHQLTAFLTRAGERFVADGVSAVETPWIIAFDAQHSELHWDFVTGVAGGLKKLQRPALVLAIRPGDGREDDARREALGSNRVLRPALRSSLGADEAVALGQHLNAHLPANLHRSREEWARFLDDTLRSTSEGPRSLFWVALRFWLLRVPGTEGSLRVWLSRHVAALLQSRPAVHASVLEIAALAKHRLMMPRELLSDVAIPEVRRIASDSTNPIGLVSFRASHATGFSISHPLMADELLRIAASDDSALAAAEKPACVSAFDLELHLLERIISRRSIGSTEGIMLVESLVTSALRVDPREAPRNFQERDRIVAMLELVPDEVFDASQIFNHHLAKARRHLATDPPDSSWNAELVREQLELAEEHLLDALNNIVPDDEQRRESPLNLRVSLALTYDVRAKHEHRQADAAAAARYRDLANRAYQSAQHTDADNSYVLENFARFKLYQGARHASGEERVRFIVDAISLLQWERRIDETGRREEPILIDLANAYEALERDDGRALLKRLAVDGSEAAIVALAQLAMRTEVVDDEGRGGRGDRHAMDTSPDALAEAERLLRRVPAANVTSRSVFVLYQVVSRLRPLDLAGRLETLLVLDADSGFPWPLQARLEFGILLYQVGQQAERRKGQQVFQEIRDQLSERSAALRIPEELRFLADPRTDFRERLRTSITVRRMTDAGRNYFGVPHGWGSVEIPFRVHDFGPNLRPGTERDCLIRFTNFGPQAVPATSE